MRFSENNVKRRILSSTGEVTKANIETDGDYVSSFESLIAVTEDVHLVDYWLVTAYRDKSRDGGYESCVLDYESSVETWFDHEPTDDELLYFLGSNGFYYESCVHVEKLKRLM